MVGVVVVMASLWALVILTFEFLKHLARIEKFSVQNNN